MSQWGNESMGQWVNGIVVSFPHFPISPFTHSVRAAHD
jgi:hypothetical protein